MSLLFGPCFRSTKNSGSEILVLLCLMLKKFTTVCPRLSISVFCDLGVSGGVQSAKDSSKASFSLWLIRVELSAFFRERFYEF